MWAGKENPTGAEGTISELTQTRMVHFPSLLNGHLVESQKGVGSVTRPNYLSTKGVSGPASQSWKASPKGINLCQSNLTVSCDRACSLNGILDHMVLHFTYFFD